MKIVYNNKEVLNTNNDYNQFLNLPMINSKPLQGSLSISDINTYTKTQIDELIANTRSIETVTSLPVNLIENTLYYVGPDSEDIYEVYLVDEVRNVIKIGTSQFGEYFGGTAIDIDDDNYIHLKIDNKTVLIDSENNLHANLSMDAVPVMVGATSSADGEKGVVPQPKIGDNIKILRGDATWQNAVNILHPVGSVYFSESSAYNPNNLFPGTTWTQLSTNRAIWHYNSANTENWAAGLPNIYGTITRGLSCIASAASGAFSKTYANVVNGIECNVSPAAWTDQNIGYKYLSFDASRGTFKTDGTQMAQADSPYGKSTTVQPPAIKICAWRRTA